MDEHVNAAIGDDELIDGASEPEPADDDVQDFLAARIREFEQDLDADRENRREAYDDIRFVVEPGSQWDERDRTARETAGRPCPSLNRLQPFLKQITNGIRRNKPEIRFAPVESNDRAQTMIMSGIKDHIERNSQASREYALWADDGVTCGIGHLRGLIEDAEYDETLSEVRLEHIADPLSVIWDHASQRRDRTDARRCWVISYLPDEEIAEAYPDAVGEWPDEEESSSFTDWHDTETNETRVCEYYQIRTETVREWVTDLESGDVRGDEALPDGAIVTAERTERVCRVWLLTGGKILEGGVDGIEVPGGRIPIFPFIPSERRIGRTKIRKGMVRDAKDSVRMINWSMALMIEAMAAAPKPKWTGPAKAFKGYEEDWEQANTSNRAFLPYADDSPVAPTYNIPPPFNVGLVNAMQVFDENIKQVTGIYDASLGARSNETSGRAIRVREEQGDTATFDFIDEFSYSLQAVGRWLVRVVPLVYNQERQIRITGEDQKEVVVPINGFDAGTAEPINPVEAVHFDVSVRVGPGFATQREEAAETIRMTIQSAPHLAPILLDLMLEMEDWPGAERAAKRLAELLPPEIKAMEGGEPMPQPQPDPKMMAEAQKDMADADKTRAEADQQRLETLLTQLQAALSGIPLQNLATMPPGSMDPRAPAQGSMPGVLAGT